MSKKYDRSRIEELDPRQLEYICFNEKQYGTEQLLINGMSYMERCEKDRPSEEEIKKITDKYLNRELYLDCNLRGWVIIIRNNANEKLYNWESLEKLQ